MHSRTMGPLGMYGIANSELERIGYNPLEGPQTPMEQAMGGGGGGFGFSLAQPQRISLGLPEKDYVGFDDNYTGAGRRGAGSFGFGGSNKNVETYKKMSPLAQKTFTNNYMNNNRYSNLGVMRQNRNAIRTRPRNTSDMYSRFGSGR